MIGGRIILGFGGTKEKWKDIDGLKQWTLRQGLIYNLIASLTAMLRIDETV